LLSRLSYHSILFITIQNDFYFVNLKTFYLTVIQIAGSLLLARSLPAQSNAPTHPMKTTKILFVLTSHNQKGNTGQPTGFYLSEAAHPYQILTEAGYAVDFVSPLGGQPPVDGLDLDDPINAAFWNNPAIRTALAHTLRPEQVQPSDYAGIFYVGGHGTMWDLPDNQPLSALAAAIYEKGGIVSAVCHGPAGLVNIKLSNGEYLVKGHRLAAFTNSEEKTVGLEQVVPFLLADKLSERGATHLPAPDFQKQVIVSGRLVTGQNPASATGVGEEIVKLLHASK
jgi:putative intracellular protease/amidase